MIKTTVKGDTRTFVVPPLSVRVDRDTDRVNGTTAPNGKLLVALITTGPHGDAYTHHVRVRSDGSYGVNFRQVFGVNVRGWDEVHVAWTNARGDRVFNFNYAPGVEVTLTGRRSRPRAKLASMQH